MSENVEQPPLWNEDEPDEAKKELDDRLNRSREAWRQVRLAHAIGSDEEEQYWHAYRRASDEYWAYLTTTGHHPIR